jgi:hypothetical protein
LIAAGSGSTDDIGSQSLVEKHGAPTHSSAGCTFTEFVALNA